MCIMCFTLSLVFEGEPYILSSLLRIEESLSLDFCDCRSQKHCFHLKVTSLQEKKKMFSNLSFFSLTSSIIFSATDSYPFLFLTLSHFTLTHDSLTWYSWCPPFFFFQSLVFWLHYLRLFKFSLFFKPLIKFYSFPLPFSVTPKINLSVYFPLTSYMRRNLTPTPTCHRYYQYAWRNGQNLVNRIVNISEIVGTMDIYCLVF